MKHMLVTWLTRWNYI